MTTHFWLRAETNPNERRTPLTPEDAEKLVQQGVKGTLLLSALEETLRPGSNLISFYFKLPLKSLVNEPLAMINIKRLGKFFNLFSGSCRFQANLTCLQLHLG